MKSGKYIYKEVKICIRIISAAMITCLFSVDGKSQNCPPNIDFETGTFANWNCYTGSTAAVNGQNILTLFASGPISGRHGMYTASYPGELDTYGGFPVNCPNGSGHSIKLGNDLPGTEAEGISYEFTIPPNLHQYSLIYNYAVVFEDPGHEQFQQPRMEIEITNVTDNTVIDCSSFTFIPNGSSLPGFLESPIVISNAPIWYKDWSAVSINLDDLAGKRIRLFFKTADCTFRRHFGYAYIDVNSECSSEFIGATYCPDDTAIVVTAPFGYESYHWYDETFSQLLGNQQNIRFAPPPPPGTRIAVEMIPYDGYGCLDTMYAVLVDTLNTIANAGRDTLSCNNTPVKIGANPKPGLLYSWSPTAGLSNPTISNPFANPSTNTTYTLTVKSPGGGCVQTDEVVVKKSSIDTALQVKGKLAFCEGFGDSCILKVQPAINIQWFKNNALIPGAIQPEYKVLSSGAYYAIITNADGCTLATSPSEVLIDKAKAGLTYPLQYAVTGLPLELQARSFGIAARWDPPVHLDDPLSYSPVFKSTTDQLYTIEIKTTSGCITVDRQMVEIIPSIEIFVPTAFTPNNDGLNDYIRPILRGIKELRYFRVFNRWGQLLYESKNESPGWNGLLNGIQQSSQVLVWLAEGIGVDGKTYFKKGSTTLLR